MEQQVKCISLENFPILDSLDAVTSNESKKIIAMMLEELPNKRNIYTIYTSYLSGEKAFLALARTSLLKSLKDNVLIYTLRCCAREVYNVTPFLIHLLEVLDHAIPNIGNSKTLLDRTIKYIVHLSLLNSTQNITLFIREAHLLKKRDLLILPRLIECLKAEEVHLLVILLGEELEFSRQLRMLKTENITNKIKHFGKLEPLNNEFDIVNILSALDNTATKYFFPKAYNQGYRLQQESITILKAFLQFDTNRDILHTDINIPVEAFTTTIEVCLKIYGSIGKAVFWPYFEEWVKVLEDTKLYKCTQDY